MVVGGARFGVIITNSAAKTTKSIQSRPFLFLKHYLVSGGTPDCSCFIVHSRFSTSAC